MNHVKQTDLLSESNSLYHHHINIRPKAVIIHHLAHTEEIPVFFQVHHILNIKEKWFIIAEQLNTISFNDKLWCYEIEFSGILVKMDAKQCFDVLTDCFDIYTVEEGHFINILTRLTKQ